MRWHRYKCENSQNIVQNVYNSLQSSFLSLAWPWPGRSLSQGTSGSAGTLDWGPIWLGFQSTCHPHTPLISPTPLMPQHPHPLGTPNAPWCPYTPSSPQVPTVPASPQYTLTPLPPDTPWCPQNGPYIPRCPLPLMSPIPLLAAEYLQSLPAPIHP